MDKEIYGQCPKCGGHLTNSHKCWNDFTQDKEGNKMHKDFKQWLCEKSNMENNISNLTYHYIEILIKAMWAINRESDYEITIDGVQIIIDGGDLTDGDITFLFKDYNNSEQTTLEAALKYIWEQSE